MNRRVQAIKGFTHSVNRSPSLPICKLTSVYAEKANLLNDYRFRLAIVVGDLESRQIGPRSHVWAEPAQVDKAAYEFAEVIGDFD